MSKPRCSALRQALLAAIAVTLLSASMFDDQSILNLQLRFDFDAFCENPDKAKCDDLPAEIVYTDSAGDTVSIGVRLKIRGRWGGISADCQLPALFVFFNEEDTSSTVFAGQSMLPLTTHCRHLDREYWEYTLSEYLAHRIYALLTPVSISARLANIDYVDTGSDRHRQRPGFFTEHFARVASRTSRQYYEPELLHMSEVDAQAMARHALFQYMIGNLDWSAVKSHNVALFRAADGRVSPAPFDFDYSGLVAAEYAAPPKGLKVSQVSTRLFRGYCVPGTDWDAIFEEFMSIRGALLEEINGLPWTLSAEKRRVRLYLKYFYDKIESRRGRQAIIDSCRPVPESLQ